LEEDGYEVTMVADGRRLINVIKKVTPDIAVLDMSLAGQDCLDLLHRIRKEFYKLPVILHRSCSALTCYPRSIAADYYVVKSWDMTALKAKIRMALEGTRCIPHPGAYINSPPPASTFSVDAISF
jgi:DNA-binding response OmpR family regulator